MSEGETLALKEALHNQYVIIKKLYQELEEERESASTAANEALSMILRLQREKAAEKMEACQYKRMTEEKMHHAEECVVALEEATQQKDIEISILKNHIQAYKHKLMTLGVRSFEFVDALQSENSFSCGETPLMSAASLPASVRRNISLPSMALEELSRTSETGNDISPVSSSLESIWKTIGNHTERNKDNHREFSSLTSRTSVASQYSEELKGNIKYKLNSVLQLSPILSGETSHFSPVGGPDICLRSRGVSCSNFQAEEQGYTPLSTASSVVSEHIELETRMVRKPFNNDIFVVPESDKCCTSSDADHKFFSMESAKKNVTFNRMEDIVPPEAYKYLFGDEGKLRKEFIHTNRENKFFTASKDNEAVGLSYPAVNAIKDHENKNSETSADIQIIKSQLEQLEEEKMGRSDGSGNTKEQLQLLKDIYSQLHTIQNQLNRPKSKDLLPQIECPLVSAMELYWNSNIL